MTSVESMMRLTELINVTIVAGDDVAGYDPEQDADLYEYWKAEERYWQAE